MTDSNGLSSQSEQTVVVSGGALPAANFVFSPTSPLAGQSIFFNGTTSTAGAGHQIVRWDWNFGDGSSRSGSTVTRAYSTAGSYSVVLTVTDEVGQTAQTTSTVTVSTGLSASFTFSPTDPTTAAPVNFNASGSTSPGATITSYVWEWGDGTPTTTTSSVTTSHQFSTPATYIVTLTVRDSRGRTANTTGTVTVQ